MILSLLVLNEESAYQKAFIFFKESIVCFSTERGWKFSCLSSPDFVLKIFSEPLSIAAEPAFTSVESWANTGRELMVMTRSKTRIFFFKNVILPMLAHSQQLIFYLTE